MSKQLRIQLDPINHQCFSRSEAREILADTDGFDELVFDFDCIDAVGQAFADEIYRVFHNKYPKIEIQEENMNDAVRFMIDRAKNEAKRNQN